MLGRGRALRLMGPIACLCAFLAGAGVREASATPNGIGDSTCQSNVNIASIGCFYGLVQFASWAQWENPTLVMSDFDVQQFGGHIGHGLWAYSGAPCGQYTAEIGITYGFKGQRVTVYYAAWKNDVQSDAGAIDIANQDGSVHQYYLEYQGGGSRSYNYFLDGQYIINRTGMGYGNCMQQTGTEVAKYGGALSSDEYTGNFDATPLYWRDTNYNWIYGWTPLTYWVDYPCWFGGDPVPYPYLRPPQCLNAGKISDAFWASNKPLQ